MSSNTNHINLGNYEEYFILYMDNELSAEAKQMVKGFASQHPHLAEELETLMSTKLPVDDISFYNKEALLSSAMKMNTVDEALLLYVDNELSGTQKKSVEEKINTNIDYALQHSLLMQTKPDAAEIISYPNKKELYRHTERVVYFPVWMRVAVAIIILLSGSLFFLLNTNNGVVNNPVAIQPLNQPIKNNIVPEQKNISIPKQKEETVLVQTPKVKKSSAAILKATSDQQKTVNDVAVKQDNNASPRKREVIKFDAARFTNEPNINDVGVNKTIAHTAVTSPVTASYYRQNDPKESAVTDGDFEIEKKTRAKGFIRKVSRFIQRNTGIGTVNADNELLVGAMALKLK